MKLFGKDVGDNKPTLIIVEVGLNHNGSLSRALEMIDVAKASGADVVKFQKRDMKTLYRKDVLAEPSRASHSLGVYIPTLHKCELKEKEHEELKKYCGDVGINYLCSPWDTASVSFLESIGVEAYKIPSACLSDIYLVEAVARTNKPVILSTGMHDELEVNRLINQYIELMGDRMAVLHCTSSYPTANKDINLRFMQTMKRLFKTIPIGFSGHEKGLPITVAAVAMGADIVERHFTLDRTLPGPDHAASLEPHGLEMLVRHIRAVEEAMGNKKEMNQGEVVARETLGKVLTWAKDHETGDAISYDSFSSTSPGYGIPVYKGIEMLSGRGIWVKVKVEKGHIVVYNQIEKERGIV